MLTLIFSTKGVKEGTSMRWQQLLPWSCHFASNNSNSNNCNNNNKSKVITTFAASPHLAVMPAKMHKNL